LFHLIILVPKVALYICIPKNAEEAETTQKKLKLEE